MDKDKVRDISSSEYHEKRKQMEDFQARLSKMFADTGIKEVTKLDEDNDSQSMETYTINFSNGVKKKQPLPKD